MSEQLEGSEKSRSTLLALRSIVDVVVHSGSPTRVLQDRGWDSLIKAESDGLGKGLEKEEGKTHWRK